MKVRIGMLIWNMGSFIARVGKEIVDSGFQPPFEGEGISLEEAIEECVKRRVAQELIALAAEELLLAQHNGITDAA